MDYKRHIKAIKPFTSSLFSRSPRAPLAYFNHGRGCRPKDFFGSETLAKSDFLWSMKTPGFFWVVKKTGIFFWVAKKGLRDFLGYAKKSSDFFWVDKF